MIKNENGEPINECPGTGSRMNRPWTHGSETQKPGKHEIKKKNEEIHIKNVLAFENYVAKMKILHV